MNKLGGQCPQPKEQHGFRKNRLAKILGNGYSPLAYQSGTFQKSLAELMSGLGPRDVSQHPFFMLRLL